MGILSAVAITQLNRKTSTDDFAADLVTLGFPTDAADKAKALLQGVTVPQETGDFLLKSSFAATLGIPTVTDVDLLCDLRAVFGDIPSSDPSKDHDEQVKTLKGLVPVVLLSLEYRDEARQDHAIVVQFQEGGYRRFIRTLQDGLAQLETIKAKVPAII